MCDALYRIADAYFEPFVSTLHLHLGLDSIQRMTNGRIRTTIEYPAEGCVAELSLPALASLIRM